MSRTPPAHSASSIYSEGDFVFVQLRATKGYTTELSFPATPGGMAALLRLLRQREMVGATAPQHIASPAMPIQHVVDSWLKSAPKAEPKPKKEPKPTLADDLAFYLSDLFDGA